jgi:hypothetical protein
LGSKPFRESNSEPMKEELLFGVRLGHAAKADGLTAAVIRTERKHDIARLNFGKFVQQAPGRVAQAATAHPAGERLRYSSVDTDLTEGVWDLWEVSAQ